MKTFTIQSKLERLSVGKLVFAFISISLFSVSMSMGQGAGLATSGAEAGYDNKTQVTGFFNEPNSLPVGSIVAMAGQAQPVGYLLCDGRLLNKADYPELYDVLKNTYGGTANSTFNLPDLRGQFLRGWSADNTANDPDQGARTNEIGVAIGNVIGSKQADVFKSHNHTMEDGGAHRHYIKGLARSGSSNAGASGEGVNDAISQDKHTEIDGAHKHIIDNMGGMETRPKNIYVAYWIKAKSTLSVNGDATFTKKVKLDGDAEFTKNVTLGSGTYFLGGLSMNGGSGVFSETGQLYIVADRDNTRTDDDIVFGFNSGVRSSVAEKMRLKDSNGYLGLGVTNPTENLHVAGKGKFDQGIVLGSSTTVANLKLNGNAVEMDKDMTIGSTENVRILKLFGTAQVKELQINPTANWPDYVFEKDYDLTPLAEVEAYIQANKHLSEVPSAAEVSQQGYNQSEINATLLKKIEELTLYMIELEKNNAALSKEVQKLKSNR